MTMRWPCVIALLLVGACTSKSPVAAPATTTPAEKAAPSPPATPAPTPRVVTGFASFVMPSRNISCELTGDAVRCDPALHIWTTPPKPSSCEFDWGGSLGVSATGAAHFLCVSDAVPPGSVLPYGQSIRDGAIVCESSASGVKCTSQSTGHGFTLSREAYTLY